ncbi:MAG: GHMP kinase [Planctomycetaceae bacterium]|nr:GHMP kinase [Planctomycetaceae bacterium]MBQ2822446.1 hypothetical protein [Thermoguttaceae bacterium]MDO4424207.1 GHMP kinase [Planctomycetia bacterium]
MEIIRQKAFARAGVLGNPSDGYFGKTISVILKSYFAQVTIYEWDELEIVMNENDTRFRSLDDLVQDVRLHGYYGGVRLVKATIKRFAEYCGKYGIQLHDRTFSIRFETNIPRQVGMAGSSAIIAATLRCLMKFYGIEIPKYLQPSLILSVEQGELGITAGLQDRVIQIYEGMVFMDFSREKMREENGLQFGQYEPIPLDSKAMPPLYFAFKTDVSEPTEIVHNNLRHRWNEGVPEVREAMKRFAELAELGRIAIKTQNWEQLGELMNANFDLRRKICRIAKGQIEMVETARSAGVSAKFAGSGGAIIGTYPSESAYEKLVQVMKDTGCTVRKIYP